MKPYEKSKLYDLAAGSPLILWYAFSLWREVPELFDNIRHLDAAESDSLLPLRMAAGIAGMVFAALLVALLVFRVTPVAKSEGLTPRLVAVAGTFAAVGFQYLPPAQLCGVVSALAVLLVAGGMVLTTWAVAVLGRSFAIVPEARRLVTRGPYAWVRHPVYAFEEIAVLGTAIQFVQPASALLALLHLLLQVARIHYEEKVLARSFPGYAAYAAGKARLLPGVY